MLEQSNLIHADDWTTLIVLDACRYDIFEQENAIEGHLLRVDSESHQTSTWYEKQWKGRAAQVCLVSAHPMAWWMGANRWFQNDYFITGDTEGRGWKHPSLTIDRALELNAASPEQRLLIHLIPPHLPFQGPEGVLFHEQLRAGWFAWKKKWDGGKKVRALVEKHGRKHGWDEIRRYYIENLHIALAEARRYAQNAVGKVVITSDHGELIGENGKYGHSDLAELDTLRIVPWLKVR